MDNVFAQIKTTELKGSTFRSRILDFGDFDIYEAEFKIVFKKSGNVLPFTDFAPQKVGNTLIIPYNILESYSGEIRMEAWITLDGVTDLALVETMLISAENSLKSDAINQNVSVTFGDVVIPVTFTQAIVNIGGGTGIATWDSIQNKPTEFPPENHTHSYNDLNDKPTIPQPVDISGKQDVLVSGTNIKTVNGQSILGAGNVEIEGSGGSTPAGIVTATESFTSNEETENLANNLTSGLVYSDNTIDASPNNISQLNIPVTPGTYIYEGVQAVYSNLSNRRAVMGISNTGTYSILLPVKLASDPTVSDFVKVEIEIPSNIVAVSVAFQTKSVNPKFYRKQANVINIKSYVDSKVSLLKSEITQSQADLSRFKFKLAQLKEGENVSLSVAFFGDSWTQSVGSAINYVRDFSKIMKTEYGDGGAGFYDFSRSGGSSDFMRSADIDDATDERSGTITYRDKSSASMGINIADATFAVGATLTLNILKPQQSATIHFNGGGGSFSYKIGNANAVTVNTASYTGYSTINITLNDIPESIVFTGVSGSSTIYGIDLKRNTGVRVHKLGNRGLISYQIASVNQTNWVNGLKKLNLDTFSVLLGTNDKTNGRTASEVKNSIKTVLQNVASADPLIDRMIICPSNNRSAQIYDYEIVMKELSIEEKVKFLSLIPLFGTTAQITSLGSFFDLYHPTPIGGKMVAKEIYKALTD